MLRKPIILSALLFVDKRLVKAVRFFCFELLNRRCVNNYSMQNKLSFYPSCSILVTINLLNLNLLRCARCHAYQDKSSYDQVGCSVIDKNRCNPNKVCMPLALHFMYNTMVKL